MIFVEVVGWTGSALILAAYALLSVGRLSANAPTYQLMNIGGGIGMTINGWFHGAYPSSANNTIWAIIGLTALTRILSARRS